MRIACLVTGAPRTFRRCAPTLKFYLSQHDVDFFVVYRDDNADEAERRDIERIYRPAAACLTSAGDTAEIEAANPVRDPMTIRMWHEVALGLDMIRPRNAKYDLFIRTRFDGFFLRQYVDPMPPPPNTVTVPDAFAFCGINDMHAEADWIGFQKYTSAYNRLSALLADVDGAFTPELLALRNIRMTSARLMVRDMNFALMRPWFAHYSGVEFEELICRDLHFSLMKHDYYAKQGERADAVIERVRMQLAREAMVPLGPQPSRLFYGVETSKRDGLPFRWFQHQAHVIRCVEPRHKTFEMLVHFHIKAQPVDYLRVFFDHMQAAYTVSADAHGRWLIRGKIPDGVIGLTKIALLFTHTTVPAEEVPGSIDNRSLSAAIGPLVLLDHI